MPPPPGANRLEAAHVAGGEARRAVVMLHGIYGRGRNWQAIARALVAARPEYGCWLVDLPHHGASGPGAHGETVSGLAADVSEWLDANGIVPAGMLGHSFGGKVALAIARRLATIPLQLWIVDSTPDVKPPSGSAWEMLQIVRRLPARFPSREAAADALTRAGFSPGVAQWMTTNLAREGDGFVWHLDFDAMERLLRDFFSCDLWDVVESPAPHHHIHFVKASESSAISQQAVARIEAAARDRVQLHRVQGGHWIHAESPDVVVALLVENLA
jgi:pimeloyl-ACP methyl ester carboxylesterase